MVDGLEVDTRLVLEESIDAGVTLDRPLHVSDETSTPKAVVNAALANVGGQAKRPILIEKAVQQVRLAPFTQLELMPPLCLGGIDAGCGEPALVLPPAMRVQDG